MLERLQLSQPLSHAYVRAACALQLHIMIVTLAVPRRTIADSKLRRRETRVPGLRGRRRALAQLGKRTPDPTYDWDK